MNERIKQLAEQAGLDLIHGRFMTASQEKFTELVVAECARLIDAEETQSRYGDMLKQHFGVEE